MGKIFSSGEGPKPFDGMMMEYDADNARAKQEEEAQQQKLERTSRQNQFFKDGEVFEGKDDAWQMHDKLVEESVEDQDKSRQAAFDKYYAVGKGSSSYRVDNDRNRVPKKGGESVRGSFDKTEESLDQ